MGSHTKASPSWWSAGSAGRSNLGPHTKVARAHANPVCPERSRRTFLTGKESVSKESDKPISMNPCSASNPSKCSSPLENGRTAAARAGGNSRSAISSSLVRLGCCWSRWGVGRCSGGGEGSPFQIAFLREMVRNGAPWKSVAPDLVIQFQENRSNGCRSASRERIKPPSNCSPRRKR